MCVLAAACGIIALPNVVVVPHGLEITSLDVGQADAAVIRTPDNHVILIDTGGELERAGATSNAERAGERIVLGFLRRSGIRSIDLMIITHPHGDHVGAARPIIDAMPVKMIFDSGQSYAGRAYQDAMSAAHARGIPIVLVRRGMQWVSGDGVTLDVLAPSLPFLSDTGDDVNENSIVVMLRADGFRELFMGDAGEASEARLLTATGHCQPERSRGTAAIAAVSGDPSTSLGMTCDDLRADVIKVGHHGSRYASTPAFVAAVQPRLAVISVGRHNTFGHPASATLETWRRAGAHVLRTDLCGAISLADQSAATMLRCAAR
jgi:competence protein ComEC